MSLLSLIKGRGGASGFGFASTAEEVTAGLDLSGKNILITGVNSGLGEETARVLHARGARIFGAARTLEKAQAACSKLGADAVPLACELAEPDSVRACVAEIVDAGHPLHVLICNAGIMALPKREIAHGQELQFLVNHIGHFILVTGLLDQLSERARVVMLSSSAHVRAPDVGIQFDDISFESSYGSITSYGQSKLANLLFARALARRFEGTGRTANALHPGVINTNLGRHLPGPFRVLMGPLSAISMKNTAQGSATQCYVAVHPAVEGVNGEYYSDCNLSKSSRHSRNEAMGERLWELSEEIVAGL